MPGDVRINPVERPRGITDGRIRSDLVDRSLRGRAARTTTLKELVERGASVSSHLAGAPYTPSSE